MQENPFPQLSGPARDLKIPNCKKSLSTTVSHPQKRQKSEYPQLFLTLKKAEV